jgi:plasmid stabilization system protein ParE
MAKKIVWTQTAIQDRFKIYQFWSQKNKSDLYSKKLERLFNEGAKLLSEFPEIGSHTDFQDI